jgi:uncharacterized protein (TIGR02246 family)
VRGALVALALVTACGAAHDPARAVRATLEQWPRDWNARDVGAVCGLFAPDVILTFPGGPDRDHAAMCGGFAATFARTDRTYRYDAPAIEEIVVDGDMAAVRLTWTLRITGDGVPEVVERERGLDVLQRQADGSWKIRISYAHPD